MIRMRTGLILLCTLAACAGEKAATSEPPMAPGWTIGDKAIGTTRFGQSAADFAKGQGTVPDTSVAAVECAYWIPAGAPPGLGLMVDSGKVVRVDVDSAGTTTAKGIGVGSTIAEVEQAYGASRLMSTPHKYNEGWRWLALLAADSSAAIVFEVDSSAVRHVHAGLMPHVFWVEHCS